MKPGQLVPYDACGGGEPACFSGVTSTLELGLKHMVQALAAVSATFRWVYMFGKVDIAPLLGFVGRATGCGS